MNSLCNIWRVNTWIEKFNQSWNCAQPLAENRVHEKVSVSYQKDHLTLSVMTLQKLKGNTDTYIVEMQMKVSRYFFFSVREFKKKAESELREAKWLCMDQYGWWF